MQHRRDVQIRIHGQDVLQFAQDAQVGIRRTSIGAQDNSDAGLLHLSKRMRWMLKPSMGARAIDDSQLRMPGKKGNVLFGQIVPVDHQCLRCLP